MNKYILYIATIISILTYSFWELMPNGYFFYGNAIFILLICTVLFLQNKKSFICFFLFCISLNNIIDEVRKCNTIFDIKEVLLIVIIPAIWLYKTRNDRKARAN